jgi:hypothetical protein
MALADQLPDLPAIPGMIDPSARGIRFAVAMVDPDLAQMLLGWNLLNRGRRTKLIR